MACRLIRAKPNIGPDNDLSPDPRQAIIWRNNGILSTRSLPTNFSEIWIKVKQYSFKKIEFENVYCKSAATLS